MLLAVNEMTENLATQILYWKYDKPYDFYNNEVTEESLKELMNGSYRAVIDEKEALIGFFCTGLSAQVPTGKQYGVYDDPFIDIGLGMDPNLVGKGNGYDFCTFFLGQLEESNKDIPIRLTVASFNKRAIRLYEKLGFVKQSEFSTDSAEFLTMIRK
ncbi:GNAT family protein [Bacillus sp. 31A1R]|uniref:GNAT family protein n=1 Tax=Robertmurraya mangrovi TaxID=3098077 RepID=A0ABU5ITA6_9BACI|nr:GNAT family protein [Bacillus sp. 31A1R]MDZ5470392.1 GNAT family protein [Bacillus sp. 31A1R]